MPPTGPQGQGAPPPGGRGPDPRAPVAREREVIEDDPAWRAQVADRLRSIRNALFGVGLLALLGLALGVYLLATRDDDGNDREAASRSQVRNLEDRVDRLESQIGNRASESDVDEIQQSQSQIAERLDAIEQEAAGDDDGDTQQLEQAIESLSEDVQELSQRVDEVEQEQQQSNQP